MCILCENAGTTGQKSVQNRSIIITHCERETTSVHRMLAGGLMFVIGNPFQRSWLTGKFWNHYSGGRYAMPDLLKFG